MLQVFDEEGKFLSKHYGGSKKGERLMHPGYGNLAFDRHCNILLPHRDHKLQIFRPDFTLLTTMGDGRASGPLCNALSVCVDLEGRILVGDSQCRIQVFAFES